MKTKLKAKLVSLVLVVLALVSTTSPAFAATMRPSYVNTDYTYTSLNFSGDKADCTSIIEAKTGTTKITATILLKRVVSNGTVTVKSWKASASGEEFLFNEQYYVSSGYDYMLEVDAAVTRNGTTEYLTLYDYDHCG